MRCSAVVLAVCTLASILNSNPALASDERMFDSQAMAALIVKAEQAQPKDQCFLYAELVHEMSELAGQQLNAGDGDHASATLKTMQHYADKIHAGLSVDSRKMKNAEELMRLTSFRLKGILNAASYEDRQALQMTLDQLERVQTELMMQVFRK
jgi:hypothetical protein